MTPDNARNFRDFEVLKSHLGDLGAVLFSGRKGKGGNVNGKKKNLYFKRKMTGCGKTGDTGFCILPMPVILRNKPQPRQITNWIIFSTGRILFPILPLIFQKILNSLSFPHETLFTVTGIIGSIAFRM
jgi:hypothetical protein